jgi:hypothetical protein
MPSGRMSLSSGVKLPPQEEELDKILEDCRQYYRSRI